jgi:hypothetical protein
VTSFRVASADAEALASHGEELSSVRQGRSGRLDSAFGCDFQSAVEGELDLAGGLFARISVRHDAGPLTRSSQFSACAALRLSISHRFPLARFDDLGNETFVTCFRRVPNPNFVVARVGLHGFLHHGWD